jgi:hypothetical protein
MPTPKFQPGQSGNPAGRPANKTATALLRKAISEAMPEIIQSLIDQAKKGDVGAATVLLNRCVPALKPEAMAINLVFQESLAAQGSEIIKAAVTGAIPPDIGSQLIAALSNQAKIIESDEVLRRLELLENSKGLK